MFERYIYRLTRVPVPSKLSRAVLVSGRYSHPNYIVVPPNGSICWCISYHFARFYSPWLLKRLIGSNSVRKQLPESNRTVACHFNELTKHITISILFASEMRDM